MRVDFWLRRVGWPVEEVDIEKVFEPVPRGRKKVLLVENQEEHDYCWAMQMMLGSEIEIIIDRGAEVLSYLKDFSRVFTTWNPRDRNRI
ncbi:hypothetical protein D3C84_323370 [compost metagenome]